MTNKLETALNLTEAAVDVTLKSASKTMNSIKRFRKSVHTGNLKDITRYLEESRQALMELQEQFQAAQDSWEFDEEAYFSDRDYIEELLSFSESQGFKIYELDNRLFCYPCIVKCVPSERCVMIDKSRERRIRPSFLIDQLKNLQNKPVRFKPDAFLESLYNAYVIAVQKSGKTAKMEMTIPLIDIHALLTLLPGQAKEYSRQEFARDIYLLDQSNTVKTKKGCQILFAGSTGTKTQGRFLTIVTQSGQEKKYSGISFTEPE
jgi:hypothetical protein